MLSEFAFTPSIFDEESHGDKEAWIDQLRELNSAMFPRTSAWPIVVSDLFGGSWLPQVEPSIERISDHRAKRACKELIAKVRDMLVIRPACHEWPGDLDDAWCREAVTTHAIEPIDRIVSVPKTKAASPTEFAIVRCINEVVGGGFWSGINSDASPRMVVAEQVQLLRKICLHSDWVALISPYGFTSEQEFTVRVIIQAMRRPPEFGPFRFEVHVMSPDSPDQAERTRRQESVLNNITGRIRPVISARNPVDIHFWPSLLDRIVIAGYYSEESDGTRRKSPRWGISMSHLAQYDQPSAPPTEWKLLRRDALDRWFRTYISEDAAGKPTPATIVR